jgi:3-dehydroquinate dehydratase/shikimate dehydrogenase
VKICQTISESTMPALIARRNAAAATAGVSLVELRLDFLPAAEIDVAAALKDRQQPVIVTCRPRRQGGRFDGDEATRLRVLSDAARLGADFIDVEDDAAEQPERFGARVVLSHHDFTPGVPADLGARAAAMKQRAAALGGAVVKIAVTPRTPGELIALRHAVVGAATPAADVIAIGMGAAGMLSRLIPQRFSGAWMYAGDAAPGQLSAADMVTRFRAHTASASTRVFGITGRPLAHSASPAMHMAAFAAAGLDAMFVPVESDDADEVLALADDLSIEGLAVTAPLKQAIFARVEPSALARDVGAVNTVRRGGRGWEGENFDAPAFAEPLQPYAARLRGRRGIVVGAGGAARSAVRELAAMGVHVEVSARDAARGAALAAAFGATPTTFPPSGTAAVIVNATPVGTAAHGGGASAVPAGAVKADVAYDLVYNPERTPFLEEARAAGAATIGGLAMLVAQARRQFAWWTGRDVERGVFEAAAREFIR